MGVGHHIPEIRRSMMPRKRIIVIDPDADRRGRTRFALETMGHYRVIIAASVTEAAELGSEEICAGHTNTLLLAYFPVSEKYLLDVAGTLDCPWLFIAPDEATGRCWPKMADVLERVKVATARKRGPMRGMKRAPKSVQPALAEACA
jgi:hypothetical protein